MVDPVPAELRARLGEVSLRDESRLRRRIDGASRIRAADARSRALADVEAAIDRAAAALAARRVARGPIEFPSARRRSQG